MKKIFLTTVIIITAIITKAQGVAVNNNGIPPDTSAVLDISSHTKGVLIPRLRTTERTDIVMPAEGLLVFDIDTKTFWFYQLGWKEILNNGATILPTGAAGGDLSGNYPTPQVVKIQNLDVSPVFPFDKQVMKWDAINNRWQGLNDSLFLPYNVTFGSPTKLFGITNANTTGGSSAIYGKSGNTGSGITPAGTSGVWGDNSTGAGVVGTSNTGQGLFGFSFNNNGVQGYSTLAGMAGVYGSNANANGIGTMGEIQNTGYAIYGKSTGTTGKGAWFQNTNANNTDTTLKVSTAGTGRLSSYNITNSSNTNPAIDIYHEGNGKGLQVYLNNNSGTSTAVDAVTNGNGIAVYGKSESGIAGKFEITNSSSPGTALYVATAGSQPASQFIINNSNSFNALINGMSNGKGAGIFLNMSNTLNNSGILELSGSGTGRGIDLSLSNPSNTSNALYVNTEGAGTAGYFNANNTTSSQAALKVKHQGTGRGIESIITNSSSNAAAIYGSSSGANAIQGFAQVVGVHGQTTGLTGGIGVQGLASANSASGIGVKGISYSYITTNGAVTGENIGDGVGVYGSSTGANGNGIGVSALSSGLNGVGVFAKATGTGGTGIKAENNAANSEAVYGLNTGGGTGIYGNSQGANARGVQGLAQPTNGTLGIGVLGQSFNYGDGIRGFGGLGGNGVSGFADNGSSGNGVYGEINGGTGYGIKGVSNISTRPAILGLNSAGDGVAGTTNGSGNGISGTAGTTGAGIYGSSNPISSTGRAALFTIPSASNNYDAVQILHHGLGANLYMKNYSASSSATMMLLTNSGTGNFAVFENGAGSNKIRFDNTGKGFFNGGTQTGGADMAEVFDVVGDVKNYEPGDVLIISTDKDRTVVRSNGAYSNLVAGVYATKPGMLMTEESIDTDLSSKVPMGVLGVIPTKVCLEGGEIKRGDFIVTSSLTGIAMKADLDRLKPGQIIGKALENFSANGTGKIRVLVNVK